MRRLTSVAVCLALALLPAATRAQSLPAPAGLDRSLPVVAEHGMVSSADATASGVGLDVLKRGGNAIDAAVATGFALAVTLPRAGNLGGGGFMLVYLAGSRQTTAIDYREIAPAATDRDVFLDENGKADPQKSQASGLGVGIPGTVAGLALAEAKYGSGRFTLGELIAPAVRLARQGIPVEGDLADSLPLAAPILARFPASARIFLHLDGSPLHRGDRLVQADLADTLEAIGRDGPAAFYAGRIAAAVVDAVRGAGGRMTLADMQSYRAVERTPVRGTYRGYTVVSMPPPSSGGVHIIEILNMLEGFPLAALGQNSAATIHLMAEAMKLAYADRATYLGDPDFVHVPVDGLISKRYAAVQHDRISATRSRPALEVRPGNPVPYESEQTTHFCVVDQDGNAVSNTYTLNLSYGVGLVADGTGVLLNNELDDFAAKAGAANAFGLLGGSANAPEGRKRPLSSMSPTMVFRNGELYLVTGSPGGSFIITTVLQIILNVIDHGLNVADATEAPRVHDQWLPDELRVERGVSADTIRVLESMGHTVVVKPSMGSTQTIMRDGGLLLGAADTRQRGELAVGY